MRCSRNLLCIGLAYVLLVLGSVRQSEAQQTDQDGGRCSACVPCFDGGHALVTGYQDLIGAPHNCTAPACDGPHSLCGTYGFKTAAEFDGHLLLVAATKDYLLPALVMRLGMNARVNHDRGILQIFNCDREIVAQIPLTSIEAMVSDGIIAAGTLSRLQITL